MSADTGDIRGVAVLGSTGSIGASTLDVIARHPDRYRVIALSANARVDQLWEQVRALEPVYAVVAEAEGAEQLATRVDAAGLGTRVLAGTEGLEAVAAAPEVDVVMAAIVGAAGMASTLAAARAGKRVLLANKESLVVAGGLLMEAATAGGALVLPIDSEHNAVFQCLPAGRHDDLAGAGVERILLTASGGPFLRRAPETLAAVTPEEACAHPNWSMGRKISVDSATMMNKGLEVIEACWLFGLPPERVEVVVHPQSVVHSLVRYVDGSVLAELGHADMRTPIAHALAWPERIGSGVAALDVAALAGLEFEPPDTARFPALRLALEAARAGGTAGAVLNAANEVAVERFLAGRLPFPAIAAVIEATLERADEGGDAASLEGVLAADAGARALATEEADRMAERAR
ncbi:MAG: 1-deoxy-D-xylulose-5-phosphate reductoisomerase [Halofilum sp. (in: g-proteobacteria)]|nr:1-deoxy-D-xylulose-5-phosphate reductoisomerase [Halofilum sp. (in: g-proteobacteria)]